MNEDNLIGKYFEQYKIVSLEKSVLDGYVRIELEVEDGNVKTDVRDWELASAITDEPSDATESRNKIAVVVVDKLYDVLKDLDVKVEDMQFIIQKLLVKLKGTEEQAICNKFGVSSKYDVRIRHWEDALKK